MESIFEIAVSGGERTHMMEGEVRRRWEASEWPEGTLYRLEGMSEWQSLESFFESDRQSWLFPDEALAKMAPPPLPPPLPISAYRGDRIEADRAEGLKIKYGGVICRFFAVLFDLFTVGMILLGVTTVLATLFPLWSLETMGSTQFSFALTALVAWLYFAVLERSHYRATFGKMVFDLEVSDRYGERITFSQATVRFVAKVFIGIFFWTIAFSRKKRSLHDLIARTIVAVEESGR